MTRDEIKQTHRAIAEAMIAQDERPSMTPERLLEIRQTAELYGACYGWAGTSGRLAAMIVELLRVIDGETK